MAAPEENEEHRIALLRSLSIMDTPIEERFERITRLLTRLLDVPVAGISMVDGTRQWFKSVHGTDIIEMPRDVSFCNHVIQQSDYFAVTDIKDDKRFNENPLVSCKPKIQSYLGVPIEIAPNIRIGAVCVYDDKPRKFDEDDIQLLHDLAKTTASEIKARLVQSVYSSH